jgi:CDP-6-deoxy-D-xylo-4-hexulose-3-dehydrase
MSSKEELLQNVYNSIKAYCENQHDYTFHQDKPLVRLMEPTFSTDEIYAATETMLSTFTTMGKKVRSFEEYYAKMFGHNYGVMSNSGSSANLLSIAALANPVTPNHLKPGDEVIVPCLSWSTTIWPIIQYQLTPVFVDCDPVTFNFDLNKLEAAITPKTRAIMLVHVYGNPCDMDAVMTLAKKYNLSVIEDCCEAMGASFDSKAVGSFGVMGNLSFFFSHHITTLEGGITVTNDFDIAETLRILRAHGWSREADEHKKYIEKYPHIDPRFIFINLGYNLRPTEVQGAMGHVQLPKLAGLIDNRRKAADFYLKELNKYSDFFDFQTETPKGKHVWFGFPMIVKENAPFTVKQITAFLQANNIETRPIIAGNMARHPAFDMFHHKIAGTMEASDRIMQRGFGIACHHEVDNAAAKYVVDAIERFMRENLA